LPRGPHRQALPPRQPALRGPDQEARHRLRGGGRAQPQGQVREAPRRQEGGAVTDYAVKARPRDARPAAPAAEGRVAGGAFRLALPLYLVLLLMLAALGANNQELVARRAALVARKEALLQSVARAEVRAAAVEGPLAVAR